MSLDDGGQEPLELCLRCRGAGCPFCDGHGEVPYGTQDDEHEQRHRESLEELDDAR